jgi:type 1 fimbria pilin
MAQKIKGLRAGVWMVALALQTGSAMAAGGRISFSGALVNPSCQLSVGAVSVGATSVTNGNGTATVQASVCGNAPASFATTVAVSNQATSIGAGIAQISVQASPAGPVLEVVYN